ncbi:MAG: LCP family protein [Candidatus Shapirobacteria bacterium]|jgi:LCP family protein required for cell wall assembly
MKKIFYISSLIFTIIILLIIIVFFFSLFYISQKTKRPITYFPQLILNAISQNSIPEKVNFMILGLDPRNDLLEKTDTTDTIIFSQVNFSQNKIHLFSLPRDLWDYPLNTKINQIYSLSLAENSDQEKFDFISQNYSSISGQTTDRVLILTTQNLKQLADILGGIDVYLETGFKDEKYPNQAYIDNPKSGAPIYITIEFKTGWVHLDSSNITEFVRSRKSSDTAATGGTDLGRIARQQQLINGLIDKLRSTLSQKPRIIFPLYNFWTDLETNFTDADILSYALKYGLKLKNIQIERHPVSAGEDPEIDLIYHPKKFINTQWVFIPQDKNYQAFQQYISNSLLSL